MFYSLRQSQWTVSWTIKIWMNVAGKVSVKIVFVFMLDLHVHGWVYWESFGKPSRFPQTLHSINTSSSAKYRTSAFLPHPFFSLCPTTLQCSVISPTDYTTLNSPFVFAISHLLGCDRGVAPRRVSPNLTLLSSWNAVKFRSTLMITKRWFTEFLAHFHTNQPQHWNHLLFLSLVHHALVAEHGHKIDRSVVWNLLTYILFF